MTAALQTLLTSLQSASTLEDLQAVTEAVRDHYGIRHAVYHWVNSNGERFGAGTYCSTWVDRYLEKDYLRMDPVIFGCFQRFTPANWKDFDWSTKNARAMFLDALDHGLGNQGYSIPLHGPQGQFALFTLNHSCEDDVWEAFIEANDHDLIVLAHEFNKKALQFEQGADPLATPQLSPRELASIRCLARGLSRAQAADELGISEHTIRVYIESARHKLGAINTTHAVARALSTGIIIV
ncbi:LuxR family transcriptional regulator [uncultured Maritimibacter sp.]|jgi:DNA-binding CsgD family transcriptional regulator|uniref:helix-turn-helix transcriptional regulator n=1 Tax=uncultured Maritimibacter sp. TaxID=991866 RepID=UPI00262B4BE2|nr:LuxR family transcriptional regulator [uncultured Maritimibacter sp.]